MNKLLPLLLLLGACHLSAPKQTDAQQQTQPKPEPQLPRVPNAPNGNASICFSQSGFGKIPLTDTTMRWTLNGQLIWSTLDTVRFVARAGIDTLVYIEKSGSKTRKYLIYCDFRPDSLYVISYNECCGGFYLNAANSGGSERDTAAFLLHNAPADKRLIGYASNAAVFLKNDQLIRFKGSNLIGPMGPNTYPVGIMPFRKKSDKDAACFVLDPKTGAELVGYDEQLESLFEFSYISLHGDCPLLHYDWKTKKGWVEVK